MTRPEKTVFISYRRTDISWALAVYQDLSANGFDVFFDYKSIYSGDFDQIIISNIKARAHFLVILTPNALDRCNEPGDWLRREIEMAITERRNIVPLFFEGFDFGLPAISEKMSGKLEALKKYNGLEVPTGYFEEAMERLRNKYLNVTLDALLLPVSDEVQKVVREHQAAANVAISQQRKGEDLPSRFQPSQESPPKVNQGKKSIFAKRNFLFCSMVGIAILFVACLLFGGYYAFQNFPALSGLVATQTTPDSVADNQPNPTEPESGSDPTPLRPTDTPKPKPFKVVYLGQWGSEGDGDGQFRRPWGIGVNWSVGEVYVSDDGRNVIQVFSSSGEFLGNLPGTFYGNFLALDSDGKVFARNYDPGTGGNNRIEVFYFGDPNMLSSFPLRGQSPRAIDADIYGENIYVADISDQKVYRYGPDGQVLSEWGSQGSGDGQFLSPWGIAVDRYQTGSIYVADTGNDRIQVFTQDGTFLNKWGTKGTGDGQFDSPIDVAVDTSHGYVYVLDSKNARVQVFTPEGEFLGKWGTVGRGEGEFLDPYGIVIDGDDNVYVLDTGNFRVQVFRVSFVP
jgi:DNA-binding beta-propeller fold protein YncE